MIAACREFRRWSLNHQGEFGLIFGSPLPGVDDGDIADELELWLRSPFPVRGPEAIDPGLRRQLERFRDATGAAIPLGAILVFLRCWVKLYGAVSMEVFGHLGFALDDAAPMFEITLSELAEDVGLRYVPGT